MSLSGCVTAKDMAALIAAAGDNNASICATLIGGVAAMTIAPGAAVPVIPGMGYYGRGVFCRTNQPGSTIKHNADGSIEISHGATSQKVRAKLADREYIEEQIGK